MRREKQLLAALTEFNLNYRHYLIKDAYLRKVIIENGITEPQMQVLQLLYYYDESRPMTLAKKLTIPPSTMTSMCDKLLSADLIERIPDVADRRALVIKITKKGLKIIEDRIEYAANKHQLLTDTLDEEEFACIIKVLSKLTDALKVEQLKGE